MIFFVFCFALTRIPISPMRRPLWKRVLSPSAPGCLSFSSASPGCLSFPTPPVLVSLSVLFSLSISYPCVLDACPFLLVLSYSSFPTPLLDACPFLLLFPTPFPTPSYLFPTYLLPLLLPTLAEDPFFPTPFLPHVLSYPHPFLLVFPFPTFPVEYPHTSHTTRQCIHFADVSKSLTGSGDCQVPRTHVCRTRVPTLPRFGPFPRPPDRPDSATLCHSSWS